MTDDDPCGSCRFWQPTNYDYEQPRMYDGDDPQRAEGGEVMLASGRWGECKKVAEFGPNNTSDKFYVRDASEYSAHLLTRSDFGCVEHEPGPPAPP